MRIIYFIILVLFIGTVFGQQFNVFSRYAGNPIITKNTGNFDSGDIANPDVFRDIPNNRWVMNYSAYGTISTDASAKWRMCLAYSTDLLNWTKEPTNPVFGPISGEGYIACNGSIVYRNGIYYSFYNTGPNGSLVGNYNRLATSTDLLTWTRANGGNPIGLIPTAGTFDAQGVYDPCVRLDADGVTFDAYYAAMSSGGANSIGYATSTDGINWNKHGQIMVQQNWWNTSNFAEPCGLRIGKALYLTFDAPLVPNNRKIGGAVSYDEGKSWSYFGFMLNAGLSGWDNVQVFDSYLFLNNNTWYLFYGGGIKPSGTQGMQSQIGVATAPYTHQSK